MTRKGKDTSVGVDVESEEDIPIGLIAAKLTLTSSVHATGTKRRHQAVQESESPLRSKRIRKVSERRKAQLTESAQKEKARLAKRGRKPLLKDGPTSKTAEIEKTGKAPNKRKGKAEGSCALTAASLLMSASLRLERCQRYQQGTTSSLDSIALAGPEKMELDVATSPAKIVRQDPGVLVLPCIEEPLPSTSDCGMECFPLDCKEQTVTLLPATSANISSEMLPGSNDHACSLPSNSCDNINGLPEHPSSLRPSPSLLGGSHSLNPNLGPRLGAGLGARLATSSAELLTQPAVSVKPGTPRLCSPSLTPQIRSPRTRTPPLPAGTSASKQTAPSVITPSNAVNRKHTPDGAAFPLNNFQPEELVWARSGVRHEPMWPARVVEMADVPEAVRRSFVPDTLCVAYFGPASSKKWDKDYAWVKQGNIFPFLDFATWFCGQDLKKRAKDFCTAVTEALLCTSRLDETSDPAPPELCLEPSLAPLDTTQTQTQALVRADSLSGMGAAQLDRSSKACISCQGVLKKKGKRKEGLEEGHAADLDRVCEACYKLFENKQYCWVCKRIWLPNQTDGWVGCDSTDCGFWIHAECDGIGPERLKAMEDEESEYHCPRCRAHKETPKVRAPATLAVECDGNEGDYLPAEHLIRCRCASCLGRKKVEPSVFEQHSRCREGNWRESIRVPRLKSSLSGWLAMMEGFRAEGLAFLSATVQAAIEHPVPTSVQKRLDVAYTPIQVKWSGERCGVCHSDEDFEDDELITCDRCHVTVHELCYGLRRHPPGDAHRGQNDAQTPGENDPGGRNSSLGRRAKVWICRACEDPLLKPHCCLCPVRGGALKPTSIQGRWAHVACAQWVTETQLADPAGAMEPVEGIEEIPKARWDLVCNICKQQCGAPIQCQQPRCVRAYHVMCARLDGLFMEMVARKDGMETRSYCRVHKAVKAENACVSSSLDAELLKRGVVPSRAKPKRAAAVEKEDKEKATEGDASAARCRPYVPRAERQQVFVRRRPIPQLYKGVVRHSRPQLEFLQQQCVVHTRVGDELVARRQTSAPEGLSVSGLIEHMQATEQSRLSFGRSGIHGCGLIARKTILEGDYVVDYRGTLVRPSVANLREKHYRAIGKDCYLFKVDDQHVVDATETGNLGRLINHSCGPNCYSQITRVDGITRIILRAKRDVQAGEELTYDYRFEQEEDKDRVPCHCGAPNCRKFMN